MELQVFESSEFGEIKTITEPDGTILFCGNDAAKALGYTNTRDALRRHCRYVVKHDVPHPQSPDRTLKMSFIPEPDLYRLIMHSNLPTAQAFEKWVMEIVLPTIRKTGAYLTPQTLSEVMEHPERAARLFHELTLLQDSMEEMRPKAEYYNALVDCNVLTNIRQTAKELHIPERLFTYLLEDMGFAYRSSRKILLPYAFMVTSGFAELKEYTTGKHGGVYMLFTPVGRLYLKRKIDKRLARKTQEE
jgi:prophage antirepressor-like protein